MCPQRAEGKDEMYLGHIVSLCQSKVCGEILAQALLHILASGATSPAPGDRIKE